MWPAEQTVSAAREEEAGEQEEEGYAEACSEVPE